MPDSIAIAAMFFAGVEADAGAGRGKRVTFAVQLECIGIPFFTNEGNEAGHIN